jgi:hypothetical protein
VREHAREAVLRAIAERVDLLVARAKEVQRTTELLVVILKRFVRTDSDQVIAELRLGLNDATTARRDFDAVLHEVLEVTDHALDAYDAKTRHILATSEDSHADRTDSDLSRR